MEDRDPAPDTAICEHPHGVAELVLNLSSENAIERQSARDRLVSIGGQAVPELIKCLADPQRQVRWEAAKSLGKIADPIASTALVGALEDKDGDVRWLAAVGLSAMGRGGLRPLLAALIEQSDSDWLREGAHHVCHELVRTADGEFLKPLLDALNTPEPELTVPGTAYSVLHDFDPDRAEWPFS